MPGATTTSNAYQLTPWAKVARPHDDVTSGSLEMGVYAANLALVYRGAAGAPEVYSRPERFFAATYVTDGLRLLLADVIGALAGQPGDRVLQLRTPFGGGKTHTLLALLHLARDRDLAIRANDALGDLPDPGFVEVAVLSGEELDPISVRTTKGIETRTLWGELAVQLGRYDVVAEHDRTGSAPGGDALRQVLGDRPVLVLLDEVLVYVEKAMAVARGESTVGRQAMLFIQALTEAVNGLPHAAMVYSLQASVGEAVGAEGLLTQLDHLVSRIDAKREPVTGDEVMRVVQRRLFADLGDPGVHRAVASAYADLVRRQLQAQAETDDARREADVEARRMEDRILASYPFHPALLDLMYHRWGTLPSYQRTRGALQFLASVTHALWQSGDGSSLIGPGEVDLGDGPTRSAFFSQVGERERYQSVIEGDIVSEGSGAAVVNRRIGTDSPALEQLRVGTRMATAIMLYSFGIPEGEERGVLEGDLIAATLVPGLDRNVIVAALHDLRDEELYLHYTGRRYRFEPTANLTKLVRDEAVKFRPDEVLDSVRNAFEEKLSGARHVSVWPTGPSQVPDHVAAFTLAFLHPDWDESATPLASFVTEARGGKRAYANALGLVLPDGAQFDRARAAARLELAAASLLKQKAKYGLSKEQADELTEKLAGARRDLAAALDACYARVVIPVRASSGSQPWEFEDIDLRSLLTAGRPLYDRVLDALAHRVFKTVTVDKLISLSGLGPDRPYVIASDLVAAFFSYFEFTKLTSAAAVADVVSRAVADRRLAYAPGARVDEGQVVLSDPSAIRIGVLLTTAETDLSDTTALLTLDEAGRLAPPPAATDNEPPSTGTTAAPVPGGGAAGEPAPAPALTASAGGAAEAIHSAALRLRLRGSGVFPLNQALVWLRENGQDLDVEVTVRAVPKPEGFDRIRFRNGVLEPLEEAGVEVRPELS
ncbi:MAG: DUF499 domain-containing protein [Actinomycetota bacterium]|nr:DUF499 domain-containing protein [Actinomycetota bacterium]